MTIKPSRNPYGYRALLVYQKADTLQSLCATLISHFSHSKTLVALADQMNRSARSTKQNITEGWKRNSTKEYYEFLGYALASNAELEEDCTDIYKGHYRELMGEKGVMGGSQGPSLRNVSTFSIKTPRFHRGVLGVYKPNSVIDSYLSSPSITLGVKRHPMSRLNLDMIRPCIQVRILLRHSCEVGVLGSVNGIGTVSAGLNRVVSVLTSGVTSDGCYPLPVFSARICIHRESNVRTFLTNLAHRR